MKRKMERKKNNRMVEQAQKTWPWKINEIRANDELAQTMLQWISL